MILILELPDNTEAVLKARAQAEGVSAEDFAVQALHRVLKEQGGTPTPSIAQLQTTDPDEWARQFHAWAEGHDRTTPLLSDEAISRENIYPDRL